MWGLRFNKNPPMLQMSWLNSLMALLKKSAKALTSTMRPSELVERSTHASTEARQASVIFDRRTAANGKAKESRRRLF